MHAHVELREMEAEDLDAASQSGERALGDSRAAMRTKAPVEQREILREPFDRVVGVGVEPPPHERQLSPVGLVEVLVADLGRVLRQLLLVTRDRGDQLVVDSHDARRHADRGGERADLVAVARSQQEAL